MADTVAVVTDSTACLGPDIAGDLGFDGDARLDGDAGLGGGACLAGSAGLAGEAGLDIRVVPLRVVVGGRVHDDTSAGGIDGIDVAAAFRRGIAVTTARPPPQRFARVYAEAAATGAPGIVSVHLSARMSGTVDSARLAAEAATVPVVVVDARTVGAGLGFVVAAAAAAAKSGGTLTDVAAAAVRRSTRLSCLFCLGSLDQLRKGGRGGAALPGNALGGKQLLWIVDGQIVPFEKVRTMARALDRLEQLAAGSAPGAAAGHKPVDVAVQHVANEELAVQLAARLHARIPSLRELRLSEVGPVIAVHTGADMLGVVVAPD
jgi:DegV family protein with EDD domain